MAAVYLTSTSSVIPAVYRESLTADGGTLQSRKHSNSKNVPYDTIHSHRYVGFKIVTEFLLSNYARWALQ